MKKLGFDEAIDYALAQAMAGDDRIILFGEDVEIIRAGLMSRFGKKRILSAPISEAAFVGAAVTAAMAGMRPVVEVMLIDFLGVAMDSVLNHAAKTDSFSGGKWQVPMVIRSTCGGGYGDGGQHEQSLWGWLAHIPGLKVVVPSTPADGAGLMLSAIEDGGPVIFLEHKLLSDKWLGFMGYGGRKTVHFDVPERGRMGEVPDKIIPIALGKGEIKVSGNDISIVSVGVSVHRSVEAAKILRENDITAEVIDLRSITPLDTDLIYESVKRTKRLLVVDEDYQSFGLSGEVAAVCLEAGIKFKYGRVCTNDSIPYSRKLEDQTLPNVDRIINTARELTT
jgi:pyruvate/2-oxoglutarate/acetoin dehydrogenase E1 component